MISALLDVGCTLAGQTVTLNGAAGNKAPVPDATVRLVPPVPLGGLDSVEMAKFVWASMVTRGPQ
jgi:hypothetical protein